MTAVHTWSRVRALVTGGAGFIGSHLSDRLVESGAHVTILDDFSNGRESNLVGPARAARIVRGSICDPSAVALAMEGADVVFHLAAMGSVPRSLEMPERYQEVNVAGTLQVLQAARGAGVRRVVYSASSSAYGNTPTLPKIETMNRRVVETFEMLKTIAETEVNANDRQQVSASGAKFRPTGQPASSVEACSPHRSTHGLGCHMA